MPEQALGGIPPSLRLVTKINLLNSHVRYTHKINLDENFMNLLHISGETRHMYVHIQVWKCACERTVIESAIVTNVHVHS